MHAVQRSLPFWLRKAAKHARGTAEQWEVGVGAHISPSSISRFESGRSWPQSPARLERLVAAYAEFAGVEPIAIWEDALRRWREDLDAQRDPVDLATELAEEAGSQPGGPPRRNDEHAEDEDAGETGS